MTNTQAIKDLEQRVRSLQSRCCCKSFGLTDGEPSGAPTNGQEFLGDPATGIIYYWDGNSWEVYSSGGGGGGDFYFEVTRAAAETAISGDLLIPGALYKITDRGDRGIFLTAISTNQFSTEGIRVMLVPFTYDADVSLIPMEGLWHPNLAGTLPSPGVYVAYAGFVYQNLNGNIGAPADMDDAFSPLDPAEWDIIPKSSFSAGEYVEKIFGVNYDFTNDWIAKQWDNNGNEIGYPFPGPSPNPVDYTDWNIETRVSLYSSFKNNKSQGAICGNSGYIGGGDTVIENNVIYGTINGIVGNYADSDVYIKDNTALNILKNGSGTSIEVKIYGNIVSTIDGYRSIRYNDGAGGLIIANNKSGVIDGNVSEGPRLSINDNIVSDGITSNTGNITSIIGNILNKGLIVSNTTSSIHYNHVLQGNISDNSNDGGVYNNLISESGITVNSNGGIISGNVCSYISNNSFNGYITYNETGGGIEGNYGGTQISMNRIPDYISNNSSDIYYNTNNGYIDSNTSSTISYNSNNGNISGNNNTDGNIVWNTNNGDIAGNSHDGNIYYNTNNGYIINCVGTGGFHVQNNTNNGYIDNPAGLALGNVSDTIVNK